MRQFRRLYREIHGCDKCFRDPACKIRPDNDQVVRKIVPSAVVSAVFVIGPALGPHTQRRSGLPFTYPNGELSRTGRALDELLRAIGYTIDSKGSRPYVYSSDIVQRYPGRAADRAGDWTPTPREVENCAEWLETELRTVRPRVILLLGKCAARCFLESHGIVWRGRWGEPQDVTVEGHHATAFPVYHPSYKRRNPQVVDDLYARVAKRVRKLLSDAV